eukprot:6474298-Amphidinium_carterae.2
MSPHPTPNPTPTMLTRCLHNVREMSAFKIVCEMSALCRRDVCIMLELHENFMVEVRLVCDAK